MKNILILLCFSLFVIHYSFSQPPQGAGGDRPAIGTISGTIMDAENNQPLEYSSVVIRGLKDTTRIFGSLVDEKGKFEITKIPFGGYRVTISFVGYKDYILEKILVIPPDKIEQNLGIIKVQQDENLLKNHVVYCLHALSSYNLLNH